MFLSTDKPRLLALLPSAVCHRSHIGLTRCFGLGCGGGRRPGYLSALFGVLALVVAGPAGRAVTGRPGRRGG
jgi:hypothetical protein